VTVRVLREPAPRTPEQSRAVADAWEGLVRANPRYFNGRILAFESYDAASGVVRARDEEYRAHAVKRSVDLGLSYFGITGVLCAPGVDGRARLMLARRGPTVHDYPNLWEFGPCGGIDPPAAGDTLTPDDLRAELAREAAEEVGLDLGGAELEHLALVHDTPDIGSTDLMVLVRLPAMPPAAERAVNWEVSDTRWVTRSELEDWCVREPRAIIPTTRALAAWLARSGRWPA
jgi:8-oxo-dGTP pyrophosphatase MutT (NUDIX family)